MWKRRSGLFDIANCHGGARAFYSAWLLTVLHSVELQSLYHYRVSSLISLFIISVERTLKNDFS